MAVNKKQKKNSRSASRKPERKDDGRAKEARGRVGETSAAYFLRVWGRRNERSEDGRGLGKPVPHMRCERGLTGYPSDVCDRTTCKWYVRNMYYNNCAWVGYEMGNHTLEEVGFMLGVTRERVRQIEAKALRKLRHKSRSQMLKPFSEGRHDG
jgi:hypothetical protein